MGKVFLISNYEKAKECDNVVGCDVGLKEFATLSDGTIISNPKHTKKYENKLAKGKRQTVQYL